MAIRRPPGGRPLLTTFAKVCAVKRNASDRVAGQGDCYYFPEALIDTGASSSAIAVSRLPKDTVITPCLPGEEEGCGLGGKVKILGWADLTAYTPAVRGCAPVAHWVTVFPDDRLPPGIPMVLGLNYIEAANLVMRPNKHERPSLWCTKGKRGRAFKGFKGVKRR